MSMYPTQIVLCTYWSKLGKVDCMTILDIHIACYILLCPVLNPKCVFFLLTNWDQLFSLH